MDAAKPLSQVRILVTRARKQAGSLGVLLRDLGAEVIEVPTIEIRPPASHAPLDHALRSLKNYQWLILTSVNGVDALFARMAEIGVPLDALRPLQIAAIGPATKKAIEEHGLVVKIMPTNYVAEDVVDAMRDQVRGCHVLLVRAKVARDVIPHELSAAGAKVDVAEAYETVLPEGADDALYQIFADSARRPQVVCLTSSSTAANFLAAAPDAVPLILEGSLLCASIGPITTATVRERGLPVAIQAAEYTVDGLVRAIVNHYESRPKVKMA